MYVVFLFFIFLRGVLLLKVNKIFDGSIYEEQKVFIVIV